MGWRASVMLAALAGTVAAGCGSGPAPRAAIEVDAPVALADQAVHLRVTGLDPGGPVTVVAQAVDFSRRTRSRWSTSRPRPGCCSDSPVPAAGWS